MVEEILAYNRKFVEEKRYEPYRTSKYPEKKLAVLTCMDTRLTELLPAALGLKNGDAKIIKNAGGVITHPYGSVVRSLLVAILELGVEEIMVVGHTDCGVQGMDDPKDHSDTGIYYGLRHRRINEYLLTYTFFKSRAFTLTNIKANALFAVRFPLYDRNMESKYRREARRSMEWKL